MTVCTSKARDRRGYEGERQRKPQWKKRRWLRRKKKRTCNRETGKGEIVMVRVWEE